MPSTDPVHHRLPTATTSQCPILPQYIASSSQLDIVLSYCLFGISSFCLKSLFQFILVHWRSSFSWFFLSHFASSKAMQSYKCGIGLDRTRLLFQVNGIQGAPLGLINVFQVGTCVCRDKKLERSSPIGVVPPGAIFPLTGFIEFTKFFNMARCLPHTK